MPSWVKAQLDLVADLLKGWVVLGVPHGGHFELGAVIGHQDRVVIKVNEGEGDDLEGETIALHDHRHIEGLGPHEVHEVGGVHHHVSPVRGSFAVSPGGEMGRVGRGDRNADVEGWSVGHQRSRRQAKKAWRAVSWAKSEDSLTPC